MTRHAFGFGSAVTAQLLCAEGADGRRYRDVVERLYNKIVFENDLKWWAWEIGKTNRHTRFRRAYVDKAIAWLRVRLTARWGCAFFAAASSATRPCSRSDK